MKIIIEVDGVYNHKEAQAFLEVINIDEELIKSVKFENGLNDHKEE